MASMMMDFVTFLGLRVTLPLTFENYHFANYLFHSIKTGVGAVAFDLPG